MKIQNTNLNGGKLKGAFDVDFGKALKIRRKWFCEKQIKTQSGYNHVL